jgi:hypothetical protein
MNNKQFSKWLETNNIYYEIKLIRSYFTNFEFKFFVKKYSIRKTESKHWIETKDYFMNGWGRMNREYFTHNEINFDEQDSGDIELSTKCFYEDKISETKQKMKEFVIANITTIIQNYQEIVDEAEQLNFD